MPNIPYVPAGAPLMLAMAIMFQYRRRQQDPRRFAACKLMELAACSI